jgi:REP element-mobilizing transposase RayT
MVRPLCADLKDGGYHVINRGLERRRSFVAKADFNPFMRVLGELPARFGLLVHAYALMPNHYHLLIQTPDANLSRAIQWLNVCYSVWFNRNGQRVRPLFQGRFKAILVAPEDSHLKAQPLRAPQPGACLALRAQQGEAIGYRGTHSGGAHRSAGGPPARLPLEFICVYCGLTSRRPG